MRAKDYSIPFYRFDDFESNFLTPHLSTGKAPGIEGKYLYFCLLHKSAGTGSELHYHPKINWVSVTVQANERFISRKSYPIYVRRQSAAAACGSPQGWAREMPRVIKQAGIRGRTIG